MKKLMFVPAVCLLFTACNNHPEKQPVEKKDECSVTEQQEESSDWIISGKVKQALLMDSELSLRARIISVSTTDGVVTLGGTVASEAEADKAVRIAESIEGVKSVKNTLKIKPKT